MAYSSDKNASTVHIQPEQSEQLGVQACSCKSENWIDLEYLYSDGTGVAGAKYTIMHPDTGQILGEGTLDVEGKAHVPLENGIDTVVIEYGDDPENVAMLKPSQPDKLNVEGSWFETIGTQLSTVWDKAGDAVGDAANWTWGVVQGDFKTDPSVSQIITNTCITMIPVVDQVADARDVTAHIKMLVWDDRHNEPEVWFGFLITLIGLVPVVGSLIKGLLKLIWKASKLSDLFKVLNHFKKTNAMKELKALRDGKLMQYVQDAINIANDVIKVCIDALEKLKAYKPIVFGELVVEKLNEYIQKLDAIKQSVNGKFQAAGSELVEKLAKIIDEGIKGRITSPTRRVKTVKQEAVSEEALSAAASLKKGYPKHPEKMELNEAQRKAALDFSEKIAFRTHGVSVKEAEKFLKTEAGQKYKKSILESSPSNSDDVAKMYALEHLTSGEPLPELTKWSEPVFKVVPSGEGISDYTPYFTTMDELSQVAKLGTSVASRFGLPIQSSAVKYDIYKIEPIGEVEVFINNIAPTTQFSDGVKISQKGGARQILVPNRHQFTKPEKLNFNITNSGIYE